MTREDFYMDEDHENWVRCKSSYDNALHNYYLFGTQFEIEQLESRRAQLTHAASKRIMPNPEDSLKLAQ